MELLHVLSPMKLSRMSTASCTPCHHHTPQHIPHAMPCHAGPSTHVQPGSVGHAAWLTQHSGPAPGIQRLPAVTAYPILHVTSQWEHLVRYSIFQVAGATYVELYCLLYCLSTAWLILYGPHHSTAGNTQCPGEHLKVN